MYLVNITVNADIDSTQHDELFALHANWFKTQFELGKIVFASPYVDMERAGVVIINTDNKDELQAILELDSYYPNLASYDVRKISPTLIAKNFATLVGR